MVMPRPSAFGCFFDEVDGARLEGRVVRVLRPGCSCPAPGRSSAAVACGRRPWRCRRRRRVVQLDLLPRSMPCTEESFAAASMAASALRGRDGGADVAELVVGPADRGALDRVQLLGDLLGLRRARWRHHVTFLSPSALASASSSASAEPSLSVERDLTPGGGARGVGGRREGTGAAPAADERGHQTGGGRDAGHASAPVVIGAPGYGALGFRGGHQHPCL